MPARKCLSCGDNYPWEKGGPTECPVCGDKLQYSSHAQPDRDWPPVVQEVLPDLTPEQREELDADWDALEAEKRKRGSKWSLADILAEQPKRAA